MATLAAEPMNATRAPAKAPVSTHPLFPAIVALWFAALLGLGSLILPTVLLERLVTVTGLSTLLPMAAPPLGFTARAMLAIGAAAIGAVLGLMLARRVAESHVPQPKARFTGGQPACRPISAHDELGEESIGSGSLMAVAQKRRSLAIAEDSRRSAYLQHVPLPGEGDSAPLAAAEPDDALELGEFAAGEAAIDDLDQDDIMTDGPNYSPPGSASEVADELEDFAMPAPAPVEEDTAPAEALQFEAPSLRRKQDVPSFLAPYDFGADEQDYGDEFGEEYSEEFDADVGEPVAPALAANSFESAQPQSDWAVPAQHAFAVVKSESDIAAAIAAGVDDRPLDDLGLVQLAARLGASIERRRLMRASLHHGQPNRPAPAFAANPEDFDAAGAEDAARARASFFAPQAAEPDHADEPEIPLAFEPEAHGGRAFAESVEEEEVSRPLLATKPSPLRDFSFDEDDDGDETDLAASLSMPRHAAQRSFDSAVGDEGDAAENEDDDCEFSSLLTMTNPFQKKTEFVRIEEPESDGDMTEAAVTFPTLRNSVSEVSRPFDPPSARHQAAAPADPGDAERELRAALATLQRMSGAA